MANPLLCRALAATVVGFVLLIWALGGSESYPDVLSSETFDRVRGVIPNKVHYVHVMRDPNGSLDFEFKHFLSIYSTSLFLRPDVIYFHTDASDETIRRAQGAEGDEATNKWNKLIFNTPRLKVNKVVAPTVATVSKVNIWKLEHKSDFVRARVVNEFGGIYLDWDAHPLRDIKVLRESGFNSIVGRQVNGQVQSGTFLSKSNSLLMSMWTEEQDIVYNGRWTTHSNNLLTRLAPRLVRVPGEVLIMDQAAFTPGSWSLEWNQLMYQPHLDIPATAPNDTVLIDEEVGERWKHESAYQKWEIDYSSTYVIHAFAPSRNGLTKDGKYKVNNFNGITAKYVLARQSNFARAVYPAVRHMFDAGLISADD